MMVLRAEQQGNESCDTIIDKDSSNGVSGEEKIPTPEGKGLSVKGTALDENQKSSFLFFAWKQDQFH